MPGGRPTAAVPVKLELEEGEVPPAAAGDMQEVAAGDAGPMVLEVTFRDKGVSELPAHILQHSFLHFLDISHNNLQELPAGIGGLSHLVHLNASNNQLSRIPKEIQRLSSLVRLDVSHNRLQGVPEELLGCTALRILYMGANYLETFPDTVCGLAELRRLYLGSNRLRYVPDCVAALRNLEVLYLGGNRLQQVTKYIDRLSKLSLLYLGDNRLVELPSLQGMKNLRTLNIHNNRLTLLPPSIITLPNLQQLSLRGNPLVQSFVQDMPKEVLSLREICARQIKNAGIPFDRSVLPDDLCTYLSSGRQCTNPACDGWYFTGVKSVDFVDVCGKYRVPLMKFICDRPCTVSEPVVPRRLSPGQCSAKMQRVLLTGYQEPRCDDPLCTTCNSPPVPA